MLCIRVVSLSHFLVDGSNQFIQIFTTFLKFILYARIGDAKCFRIKRFCYFCFKMQMLTYLFKIDLLLSRVGIIKSHDKFSLECFLVVLVQEGSLGMSNMQIPSNMNTKLLDLGISSQRLEICKLIGF